MGFLISQIKKSTKVSAKDRNTATLNKHGCKLCPLNKAPNVTPKMHPTLADETWIYWLGQNPGKMEDEEGSPFVGPSGALLRHAIPKEIIKYSSFDNVVRDRTPRVTKEDGSVGDRDPLPSELECCRGLVTASIEQAKPKLIVGLGMIPQKWAINSEDQTGLRGRIFTVKIGTHICYFMPTYHPARILRAASERNKGRGKLSNEEYLRTHLGRSFRFDIEKACKFVKDCKTPVIETEAEIRDDIIAFNGNDFDDLIALMKECKKAKEKAVDIETPCLRPYSKNASILTVAFSFNDINFSFAIDHKDTKWNQQQRLTIKTLLKEIIEDDTIKIAHNAPFECEWFAHFLGKDCIKIETWECTQLQSSFIDERRGAGQANDDSKKATYLSLGWLVNLYFGIPFKKWFELDKKDMGNAPIGETLVYNAADTRQTLRLWHHQNELLRASGLYSAYMGAVPRQAMLALTQLMGLPVNQETVKRFQSKLAGEISVIEAEIETLDVVQKYKKDNKIFNPMGQDALTLFRDYLKRDEVQVFDERKKKIRWSVDKNVLDKIDHPLAKLIVKLRNKSKMKSTYVDGMELPHGEYIYPDGKIHCNLNSCFTTTGRLSCDSPNGQNWPSRNDFWIREQIEAPEGYTLIACDYGQLEMCGAAMCSKDKKIVKSLWEDYDVHLEWSQKLAKLCPERVGGDITDPKVIKAFRSIFKNKVTFPAIYGAQNSSMAGYMNIDVKYIDELMEEFWGHFEGIKKWQTTLLKGYYKNGFVETLTGKRRHHPLTTNEAINSPIQGTSSDIVIDTMCQLSYRAVNEGNWFLHPILNIHDDEMFLVPDNKLDEALEVIIKTLLNPTFDFINVPLSVEVKLGKNWGALTALDKFWSHKF